jgi:hypothetical protein
MEKCLGVKILAGAKALFDDTQHVSKGYLFWGGKTTGVIVSNTQMLSFMGIVIINIE